MLIVTFIIFKEILISMRYFEIDLDRLFNRFDSIMLPNDYKKLLYENIVWSIQ